MWLWSGSLHIWAFMKMMMMSSAFWIFLTLRGLSISSGVWGVQVPTSSAETCVVGTSIRSPVLQFTCCKKLLAWIQHCSLCSLLQDRAKPDHGALFAKHEDAHPYLVRYLAKCWAGMDEIESSSSPPATCLEQVMCQVWVQCVNSSIYVATVFQSYGRIWLALSGCLGVF